MPWSHDYSVYDELSEFTRGHFDYLLKRAAKARAEHLESLCMAYIKATGHDPAEIELVEQHQGNTIVWYYRKRDSAE